VVFVFVGVVDCDEYGFLCCVYEVGLGCVVGCFDFGLVVGLWLCFGLLLLV